MLSLCYCLSDGIEMIFLLTYIEMFKHLTIGFVQIIVTKYKRINTILLSCTELFHP